MSQAPDTPGSRTRAVTGRPLVSRSRTVTSASPAAAPSAPSAPVRPEASGFPRGFSALMVTEPGSTVMPPAVGWPGAAVATATRSWL